MKFDGRRLLHCLGNLVPSAPRIDQGLWIILATFPIALLLAVPDQRTAEERWADYYEAYDCCMCLAVVSTDDELVPPPPFDLLAAERDALTDYLGGFQHFAQLETPLSDAHPRRVQSARPPRLEINDVVAVADP